jgi:hypothetical protein
MAEEAGATPRAEPPAEGGGFRFDLVLLSIACVVGVLLGVQPALTKPAGTSAWSPALGVQAAVLHGKAGAAAGEPRSAHGLAAMGVSAGTERHIAFLNQHPVGFDGGIRLRQTTSEFRELLLSGLMTGQLTYTPLEVADIMRVLNASRTEFWGALRGAQRPFQAHHIAVASGMLMLRAPVHMVKLGLMHSTFGYGRTGGQGKLVDTREKLCRRRRRVAR